MKCPYCSEDIRESAKKCRFCGEWLDQPGTDRDSHGQPSGHPPSAAGKALTSLVLIVGVAALLAWLFTGGPLSPVLCNVEFMWQPTGFLGLEQQCVLRVSNPMGCTLRNIRYRVSFCSNQGEACILATTVFLPQLPPYGHEDVPLPRLPKHYDSYTLRLGL